MSRQRSLVTGGAGFIGANLVHRLLRAGHEVTVFDNFFRRGGTHNIRWLQEQHGANGLRVVDASVSDLRMLRAAARGVQRVYHLAGQVAVTTSVRDPQQDFADNALGTFNALEATRLEGPDAIFIYASTNKVYGALVDGSGASGLGVSEAQPLDPCSPYGCSKAAGDIYTRDYARIYGLRTVVLRQSCIYGSRQFGVEDQGWVAWFIVAALQRRPITICGDGQQIRDMLYVDDLLDAYDAAIHNIDRACGQAYNIGGGAANAMRIWADFGPLLEELLGRQIPVTYVPARPGDQRVFVCDIRKAERELGWRPHVSLHEGVRRLYAWIGEHLDLFSEP